MKKIYSLLALFSAIIFTFSQSTSIFDAYIITSTDGSGNVYTQLGSFNGKNLGTFNNSQSLVIKGGQNKTNKCNGGNVTGGNLNFRVFKNGNTPGSFTGLPMSWASNLNTGCSNGDQIWEGTSGTTNILTGLADGTYTVEVYNDAPGTPSTAYYSNNGSNYKASFVINNSTLGTIDNAKSGKSAVANGKLFTPKKGDIKLTVYDFSGKVVKTMTAKADGNAIDLNIAQKGMYMVKISDATSSEVVKFVK